MRRVFSSLPNVTLPPMPAGCKNGQLPIEMEGAQ
jgi:hypothetical protein